MEIKQFQTDAQHNAYTYRHIKEKQRRKERIVTALKIVGNSIALTFVVFILAQLFIGLD